MKMKFNKARTKRRVTKVIATEFFKRQRETDLMLDSKK